MPSLTIDGARVAVPEGTTVLEAARAAGIRIPTLCYLKDVSAVGSCRVCVVDVEGEEHPVPACSTVAREGMAVATQSLRLTDYRRVALELAVRFVRALLRGPLRRLRRRLAPARCRRSPAPTA